MEERRTNEAVLGEAIDLDFSGKFLDPNTTLSKHSSFFLIMLQVDSRVKLNSGYMMPVLGLGYCLNICCYT